MGATAQDFHSAFRLRDADRTIATVDRDGRGARRDPKADSAAARKGRDARGPVRESRAFSGWGSPAESTHADIALLKATLGAALDPQRSSRRRRETTSTPS